MKKSISIILISSILLQLVGCYSTNYITSDELTLLDGDEQLKITTLNNEEYETDDWEIYNDSLKLGLIREVQNNKYDEMMKLYKQAGKLKFKREISIPLSTINDISFEETNTGIVILVGVAVTVGILTLIFAISQPKFYGPN